MVNSCFCWLSCLFDDLYQIEGLFVMIFNLDFFQVIAFAERDQEDRLDPMIYIFPRMTKCTFHKFGTSGEVEKFLFYSIDYILYVLI